MTRVLVTYYSRTGHTKALAEAVIRGVKSVEGMECQVKLVGEVTNDDLVATDGLIVGSPTYFGQMAAEVKALFDPTDAIYGKLQGKVGGAFTTAGQAGGGHETALLSLIIAMFVAGMIVEGCTSGPVYGPFAVEQPTAENLQQGFDLGVRVARLTKKLYS